MNKKEFLISIKGYVEKCLHNILNINWEGLLKDLVILSKFLVQNKNFCKSYDFEDWEDVSLDKKDYFIQWLELSRWNFKDDNYTCENIAELYETFKAIDDLLSQNDNYSDELFREIVFELYEHTLPNHLLPLLDSL